MKTPAALRPVTGSSPALAIKPTATETSRTWRRWFAGALLCATAFFAESAQAQIIQTLYVLTTDGKLAAAPVGNPAPISPGIAITGVTAGETLVGIDVRPQNQQLYALGVNATTDTATLYRLSAETGYAAVVGTAGSITFVDAAGATVQFPDPAFYSWDIDFNPLADRVRVVCGSLNFRINPNNGTPVDGNLANGAPAGTNPDGPINGLTVNVDATAYTNNQPNTAFTTQYTIDSITNSLYIQNPPNNGTETNALPLKLAIGGASLNPTAVSGFDIPPGVNVTSSNSPVVTGAGYAVLTVGTTSSLYAINLVNGGAVELGTLQVRSFAIRTELGAAIAMSSDGLNLIRFSTDTPGTTTTVGITGITGGETLVGIDLRPQTGQLYALGINHTANNGTLYLLDPQLGSLTAVGATGQIAYVAPDGVTAIDLPDPATVGYGVDFNPAVDRLRVVTGSGLNFRVNPNNGAPVDGDLGGAAGSVAGVNTDGNINGLGVTGIEGAAYTNSFPRNLSIPLPTTLYTLNAAGNTLNVQNPPNAGTQTVGLQVAVNGNPLDFGALGGFDIPEGVAVGTSKGEGWFVAAVGGTTRLYRIDLQTGAAVAIGAVGAGAIPLAGLVVNTTPVVGAEFPAGTPLTDSINAVFFGATTLGNSVTTTIKVTNKGTQALTYTTALDTGAPFSIVSSPVGTIPPGGSTDIQVGFDPQSAVESTDTLHILSNDAAIPSFEVFLIGSGSTTLGDDAITVTSGDTRLNVLANDGLSGVAVITGVNNPAILVDGRALIIPSGFTGTFTYTTQDFDGTIGQATVTVTAGTAVVNPKTYSGLLRLDTDEPAGSATVTISAGGVATLQLVGGTLKAKTKITVAAGSFGIGFTPLGPVVISRNLDGTVDVIVGALGGEISGTLLAVNPAATPAKHHIALATLDPMVPGGGYVIAQGGAKGAIKVTGLLPDGVPFSVGTAIRENGTIAVYVPITKGLKRPAFVGGEFVVANLASTDVTGELSWVKLVQPAGAKGLHLGGVNTILTANGSLYNGTAPLPSGNGTLTLSGGNLGGTETNPVVVSAAGIPATPTGSLTKWNGVKVKAGRFSAQVTVPGLTKPAKGSGLYLPKSSSAAGFFPGTTEGGRIRLTVP